jgi:hypothetical protein
MINLPIKKSNKHLSLELLLWLSVFLFTVLLIVTLQLIFLPFIMPSWHAGNGLLVNGDWIAFHQTAINLSEAIREEGWSKFELRPNGWFPAGLASFFYSLFFPLPIVLAPVNAAVHATTALIAFKIFNLFADNRRFSLTASLVYVFFPSAMLWYGQIHRDGIYILGILLFIYGFIEIIRLSDRPSTRKLTCRVLLSISGIFLIWLARPHALTVLLISTLVVFLFAVLFYLAQLLSSDKHFFKWRVRLFLSIFLLMIIFSLNWFGSPAKYERELPEAKLYEPDATTETIFSSWVEFEEDSNQTGQHFQWEQSRLLPDYIDKQLYSLAYLRSVEFPARYGRTASAIDFDRSFHSATDFVLYLPRALQIAFFAPFPSMWFAEGSYEATTFFRKVAAFEMLIIYLTFPFFILGLWQWRKRVESYCLIIFCLLMMLPSVYAVPNVGTLYRYRYGFIMLLMGLGIVKLMQFYRTHYKNDQLKGNSGRYS